MPLLKDLIDVISPKRTEPAELPVEEEPEAQAGEKIMVRIENLNGMVDIDRLMKFLREGNILFLKTKDLQKRDLGAFQTSVQKWKRVCQQYGWDIVGTEEGYLVITPKFAYIVRE